MSQIFQRKINNCLQPLLRPLFWSLNCCINSHSSYLFTEAALLSPRLVQGCVQRGKGHLPGRMHTLLFRPVLSRTAATSHRWIFRVKLQSQLLSLAPFSLELRSWTRDHFQAGGPWCFSFSLLVPLWANLQGCSIKHWEHLGAHASSLGELGTHITTWHTCLPCSQGPTGTSILAQRHPGTDAGLWGHTSSLSEASLGHPGPTGMSPPQFVYRRPWAKDLSNLCDDGVTGDTNSEPPLKERFVHQLCFN